MKVTVEKVRLFHAVDVHGSEIVWRKWLSIPKVHKADILLFCGDLTGKLIIPIIEDKKEHYKTQVYGRWVEASDEAGLAKLVEKITCSGFYTHVCTPDEYDRLMKNPEGVNKLFREYMRERIERWLDMVNEKLPKEIKVVVMPGNDDSFEIDEIIKAHEDRVIYPLEKVVNLCFDHQMLSFDWVNPTPWDTPREASEEELWKKLEKLKTKFSGEWDKAIVNFHCPPYGTKLDLAPKLDKTLKPVVFLGRVIFEHVGSKSIYRFIHENQPMLGLHGHIHEAYASDKIGKTLVINPGSEYSECILRGFIVDLDKNGVDKWWKIEG